LCGSAGNGERVKYITSWRQREFLAEISGRVADNLYRACAWAADEARKNAPVLTGRTKKGVAIDVEVEANNNTIEGRIGVKENVFWAYFAEMGTEHSAAQPFLRPAVFGNARKLTRMIAGKE